jgi:hypothetical protein
VLARQYFSEGWYPSYVRRPSDARTPSGALLKAVLINSAQPLSGNIPEGSSSVSRPARSLNLNDRLNAFGWGRVNLANALPLRPNSRFGLWVVDADSVSTGQTKTYGPKTVYGDSDVRITLVWMDPASSPNSDATVINDLNLVVTIDGVRHLGNQLENGRADTANNVEKVTLPAPTRGAASVTIEVIGSRVSIGPQRFAIAMNADFDSARASRSESEDTEQWARDMTQHSLNDSSTDDSNSNSSTNSSSNEQYYHLDTSPGFFVTVTATLHGMDSVDFDGPKFAQSVAAVLNVSAN